MENFDTSKGWQSEFEKEDQTIIQAAINKHTMAKPTYQEGLDMFGEFIDKRTEKQSTELHQKIQELTKTAELTDTHSDAAKMPGDTIDTMNKQLNKIARVRNLIVERVQKLKKESLNKDYEEKAKKQN